MNNSNCKEQFVVTVLLFFWVVFFTASMTYCEFKMVSGGLAATVSGYIFKSKHKRMQTKPKHSPKLPVMIDCTSCE